MKYGKRNRGGSDQNSPSDDVRIFFPENPHSSHIHGTYEKGIQNQKENEDKI